MPIRLELGKASIAFQAGTNGKDFDVANDLASHWFKVTDTLDEATHLAMAAGVFVNQVKAGMSFAQVESSLGVPQTRVDLGEKVLYKYKDMTIEFHEGKVVDVR